MNSLINNKKGGKYLSIWWFFVIIVIAGAIVIAVTTFNTSDRDTKKLESNILINRVVDCFIDEGYINQEVINSDYNIFEKCHLSKEVIASKDYYLNYEIYNANDCNENRCSDPLITRSFGNPSFEVKCQIGEKMIDTEQYPKCSEQYVYTIGKDRELILYIRAGSNQEIKSTISLQ